MQLAAQLVIIYSLSLIHIFLPCLQQLDNGFLHPLGRIAFGEIFPQSVGAVSYTHLRLTEQKEQRYAYKRPGGKADQLPSGQIDVYKRQYQW